MTPRYSASRVDLLCIPLCIVMLVPGFHKIFAPLTLLVLLVFAVLLFTRADLMPMTYTMGGWGLEKGLPIGIFLVLDAFSILLLCIINIIGFIALFY